MGIKSQRSLFVPQWMMIGSNDSSDTVLLYLITGMMLMTGAVFHIPAGRRAE